MKLQHNLISFSLKKFKRQLNFYKNFIRLLKLFLLIILLLFFLLEFLSLKTNNKLFNQIFFPLIINEEFIFKANFSDLIEKITINKSEFSNNITCFETDEKLFWNNQKNLEIEKIREEIKNRKNSKISFENKNDFFRRKNPKISLIITVYNQGYYI